MISISEVFMNTKAEQENSEEKRPSLIQESYENPEPAECVRMDNEENEDSVFDSENDGIKFTVPVSENTEEESSLLSDGGGTRFRISKVSEGDLLIDKDEKG